MVEPRYKGLDPSAIALIDDRRDILGEVAAAGFTDFVLPSGTTHSSVFPDIIRWLRSL